MTGGTSLSQSLGTLTALDAALAQLRALLQEVPAQRVTPDAALGHVLAQDICAATPLPFFPRALRDGYALSSQEIAGASSYSPVILMEGPQRVSVGDALPLGCDCVLDAQSLDLSGPVVQVMAEAAPGEGIRRVGEDAPAGAILLRKGEKLTPRHLPILSQANLTQVDVRIPRVTLINRGEARVSLQLVAYYLQAFGAQCREATDFDGEADLFLTIGGTGEGETDRAVQELRAQTNALCHGIACAPARSMALGHRGSVPVIAMPGAPMDAMAAWYLVVKPVLMQICAMREAESLRLPLAQKLASRVGVTELVLLKRQGDHFAPLSLGDMPLRLMAEATHICCLNAASEGHAAGEMIEAFPFE